MDKYGFVYIWYDRKHKRFYIGCHWGYENDGYICSSTWMKRAYTKRPQDFKRRILKSNIPTKQLMFDEEYRYLKMIDVSLLRKRYYNLVIDFRNHWSIQPNAEEIRQKLSEKNKGHRRSRQTEFKKGERRSPQTEFKKGQVPHNKGKKLESEETRAKLKSNKSGSINGFNTRFKPSQTSGSNNPKARSVHTPYGVFETVTSAVGATNISAHSIRKRLNSSDPIYQSWYYVK